MTFVIRTSSFRKSGPLSHEYVGEGETQSMVSKIQAPKGTVDTLPGESWKWQAVERIAREVAELYDFREIRTPIFEHSELFHRGVGETTDIVSKETYTFADRDDRSITLRPEGTAGAVRAVIEN